VHLFIYRKSKKDIYLLTKYGKITIFSSNRKKQKQS
jgi:hypothetical protein